MANKRKRNTVLGLDLGSAAVKAVELSARGDAWRVEGCAFEEVGDRETYAASVRATLEAGSFDAERVVVGLSGRGTLLRTVTIPGDNPEELSDAVREETAKYVPYGLDEAVTDHMLLADEPDRFLRVLVAAAKRGEVDARLAMLDGAGVRPERIEPEGAALVNALEAATRGGGRPGRGVGVVDFGAAKTLIAVTDGARHVFREFPFGGDKLTEMIAHRLDCPQEEAEAIKRNPGERIETVKDALYPGIEDITAEVRQCLDRFRAVSGGVEAKELLLSGGLVAFPGIAPLVGRLTRTSSKLFEPFAAVDTSELDARFIREHGHLFATAFGLACQALENGK